MRIRVDERTCEIWIDDRLVQLTPTQWDVFYLLWCNSPRWTSNEEANAILFRSQNYGRGQRSEYRWHIANIRKRIAPIRIEARRGFGYRLNANDIHGSERE